MEWRDVNWFLPVGPGPGIHVAPGYKKEKTMAEKLNHPLDLSEMTAEQSIQATIEMWTDMMIKIGEKPGMVDRFNFKSQWVSDHGYPSAYDWWLPDHVTSNCFLCEYALRENQRSDTKFNGPRCRCCPIVWPTETWNCDCKSDGLDYRYAPIPDILEYLKNKEHWRENNEL